MKAVILAGGLGTRISEETHLKPKPMIEIGGNPIIWHIMKHYSQHGINEFIICCGYKGYVIKEYFANYFLHKSDISIDLSNNSIVIHNQFSEPWKVTMIDTGLKTMTGGRLKRVSKYLSEDEPFCFTYGDGVSNIDITKSIDFHRQHGKLATITSVRPPGRYGALVINEESIVESFLEKPIGDGGQINGGFFVLSPKCIDYIDNDNTTWEAEPLNTLAKENQLVAFKHENFWQPMDTLRDKIFLEELWNSQNAPWKTWK
jgi:glucose-1-phosphate cytidylyltransferase